MDMEKLTAKSREAMISSQSIAVEYGHQEIRPIHLLKALADQEGGLISQMLTDVYQGVRSRHAGEVSK